MENVMDDNFIVLTTYDIANAEIEEHLGLVQGSTVRARNCLLYTSPSPRDRTRSRMPSSA